ncbi:hypothetical protein [Phytohabitans aurantiacus]|uniref:Uncharacterized protein n=1 Tax=Phytohabitans aurantiacus TaxID=3016789 RepID=A0ABQ5R016_9ACTN|nr:hypothetical protein [Phytohabitans aurantiacus]GLH99299.1 hypothetical protein Pa4123_45740 [Phytohabitans aurantiacus]
MNDTTRRRLVAVGRYIWQGLSAVGFAFSPMGFPPPETASRHWPDPDPVPAPGRQSTDCPEWRAARRRRRTL